MDDRIRIEARIEELEKSNQPYADVVLAVLRADLARHKPEIVTAQSYLKEGEILAMLLKVKGIPKPY